MPTAGSIVRCRNREWVLLPSEQPHICVLRPLTGAMDNVMAIHSRLADVISHSLAGETIRSAEFPLPTADDLTNAAGSDLLWQAARLTLREGASPLRSLGRISIRPRVYQFVPLLMALRLDPVRVLIADDVGVGKTIEALLIARELYDRGEIKRVCVLCPPYLCDQWQQELSNKFNLEAVVIRSGTVGQLERRKTGLDSIYRYYPVQVASIDFVKSDRNRHLFLLDCPDMVIVDEAHGSAVAVEGNQSQHQRHELVRQISAAQDRHLILLTATPHSGIAESFRSLLSLLKDDLGAWDISAMTEPQRIELAKHFVQRTRRDIEHDWEGEHCFPERRTADETYPLSLEYRDLFDATYGFCSEIVQSGQTLDQRRRRVRYWGALALLRCVMSSPAAAIAALENRQSTLASVEEEPDFRSFIFESGDDRTDDEQPTLPVEFAEATLAEADRRRLRDLGRRAGTLMNSSGDTKLAYCAKLIAGLLGDGFHPIIWCRYVATADYVAQAVTTAEYETDGVCYRLQDLYPGLRVLSITGRIGDDERRAKVDELAEEQCRVLVATDCLSEGVNLQDAFNAVIHYDLPWNPNRLEQREGRVDRYGQTATVVKTIRYFSPDNPVDGVVIDVLLNKAREIHRTLGTHVPVPEESQSVTEAVFNALFLRGRRAGEAPGQLMLDFGVPGVETLHRRWDQDAERERINRTRFAQRALRPEEVRRELEAADAVLGDPDAVREFVLNAGQRLGLTIRPERRANVFRVAVGQEARAALPEAVSFAIPATRSGQWLISFVSPTPEGAEYLGRNHKFVAALARYLMEEALTKPGQANASRCGVIRTRAVTRLTTVLLLRIRYLLRQPERPPLLSEEVHVTGFSNGFAPDRESWLAGDEALRLLSEARPDANVGMAEKRELIAAVLNAWPALDAALRERITARAAELEASHKRIRQAVSLRIRELRLVPQFPPDLLGILVLQPVV